MIEFLMNIFLVALMLYISTVIVTLTILPIHYFCNIIFTKRECSNFEYLDFSVFKEKFKEKEDNRVLDYSRLNYGCVSTKHSQPNTSIEFLLIKDFIMIDDTGIIMSNLYEYYLLRLFLSRKGISSLF
jgi:hypothetical protein